MGRAVIVLLSLALSAGVATGQDYFQQSVAYTIDVRLDTDAKRITGSETILYTNNSPDTLREFFIHLYPNAYRSKNTAFMRDFARQFNSTLLDVPKSRRSTLDLGNVRIDGTAVTLRIDDTIARMKLPTPLLPGASMTIAFDFQGKVRKHTGRAGHRGNHYDFAQWYPKVVVYDENGFHPDQFMVGEFYGEFGTFDVHITLPAHYVIAATGLVENGDPGWEYNSDGKKSLVSPTSETKTVHFRAENVHDFAWCADPSFVVQETKWNDVAVRSFYRRSNAGSWEDSTLAHAVRSLDWLEKVAGAYPYPQVSVVDALLRGGMEYPMLVMDGRADEGLVVHEIGHIYYYGILGNDEREEAWLDEGFTSFQTAWFNEARHGLFGRNDEWNWYQRMTPQDDIWEAYRKNIARLDRTHHGERIATRAEKFKNSYYAHVYDKAALMLRALRYEVGDETFGKIMNEYYERWKFRHVNEERFVAVAEEISGRDLEIFFEQWLHTPKICDYKLVSVEGHPNDEKHVRVKIERKGEMVASLDIVFTLENGEKVTHRVDGRLRSIEATFDLPSKLKRTALVPNNEIADANHSDNFLPRRRDIQFDFPNNDYWPEYAYQTRWRPSVWYNDVDELKTGLLLKGSRHNWTKRFRLGVYYSAKTERTDYSVSFDQPFRLTNRNGLFTISGYRLEGRHDFTLKFSLHNRPALLEPPSTSFTVGYNYHKLVDDKYLTSPELYNAGLRDAGPYFSYWSDPQTDAFASRIEADFKLGRDFWGSDFRYERFTLTTTFKTRTKLFPLQLRARGFLGLSSGGTPLQQKFNIAGGGALQQEKRFWLRSPGAVWDELNYHEPGDGNLRGYRDGGFGVNQLAAMNLELGARLPMLGINRLFGIPNDAIKWYGFYDLGTIYDDNNPIFTSERLRELVKAGLLKWNLADAGVGFTAHLPFPFWDVHARFDVPLWVNHPEINGDTDKNKVRYLFSLQSSF